MGRTSRLLLFSIPLALLAIPLGTISVAAESTSTVRIQGAGTLLFTPVTPAFKVNKLVRIPWSLLGNPPGVPPGSTGVQETYGFHASKVRVESGEMLQVVNQSDDNHTITIVNKSDQPQTLGAAFACFATGPCAIHPPPMTATLGKVGDGNVLDLPGKPGAILNIKVTAPSGSILYFMCIFHPQMQGKIIVGENTDGGGDG